MVPVQSGPTGVFALVRALKDGPVAVAKVFDAVTALVYGRPRRPPT